MVKAYQSQVGDIDTFSLRSVTRQEGTKLRQIWCKVNSLNTKHPKKRMSLETRQRKRQRSLSFRKRIVLGIILFLYGIIFTVVIPF